MPKENFQNSPRDSAIETKPKGKLISHLALFKRSKKDPLLLGCCEAGKHHFVSVKSIKVIVVLPDTKQGLHNAEPSSPRDSFLAQHASSHCLELLKKRQGEARRDGTNIHSYCWWGGKAHA